MALNGKELERSVRAMPLFTPNQGWHHMVEAIETSKCRRTSSLGKTNIPSSNDQGSGISGVRDHLQKEILAWVLITRMLTNRA
jgi:hypothetical protein